MRDYVSGKWGLHLFWGYYGSVVPRALIVAIPNAAIAYIIAVWNPDWRASIDKDDTQMFRSLLGAFTTVMFFILQFRSNIAYDRWWEGGTLLQKTRGEWFNAYSSLMAFSSTDPSREKEVEEYHHLLARLMSLLMCCGLQQVSVDKDRGFEIIDCAGIEPQSLKFLTNSPDKVEVILQWIQRSTVLHMHTGILPIAPPVLSRAFQEVSRGIVNLQNARKIADFPFPYPYAQVSIMGIYVHYVTTPLFCCVLLPPVSAALVSFLLIFFLWCVNFIALDLESPFGDKDNDLPMEQIQADWNKSLGTLMNKRAQRPPLFEFRGDSHRRLDLMMSDNTRVQQKKALVIPREELLLSAVEKPPTIRQTIGLAVKKASGKGKGRNSFDQNLKRGMLNKIRFSSTDKFDDDEVASTGIYGSDKQEELQQQETKAKEKEAKEKKLSMGSEESMQDADPKLADGKFSINLGPESGAD